MLAFAMDNPTPATVVMITGDRDFAYAASLLRLRGYEVIMIVPPPVHMSLKMQANKVHDWQRDVLGLAELHREKASGTQCLLSASFDTVDPPVTLGSESSRSLSDTLAGPTINAYSTSCNSAEAAYGTSEKIQPEVETYMSSPIPGPSITLESAYDSGSHACLDHHSAAASSSTIASSPPVAPDSLCTSASDVSYESCADEPLLSSSIHDVGTPGGTRMEIVASDSANSASSVTRACVKAQNKALRDVVLSGFQVFQPGEIHGHSSGAVDNWTWWDTHGNHDWNPEVHFDPRRSNSACATAEITANCIPSPTMSKPDKQPSNSTTVSFDMPGSFAAIPACHSVRSSGSSMPVLSDKPNSVFISPPKISSNLSKQTSAINQSENVKQSNPDKRFALLIDILESYAQKGSNKIKCSELGTALLKRDKGVYERAGVGKLKSYVGLAVSTGLVKATKPNAKGEIWVELIKDGQIDKSVPGKQTPESSSNVQPSYERAVDNIFKPLLALLKEASGRRMLYSECDSLMRQHHPTIYEKAGVSGFSQYVEKAKGKALVTLGGIAPQQWVEATHPIYGLLTSFRIS